VFRPIFLLPTVTKIAFLKWRHFFCDAPHLASQLRLHGVNHAGILSWRHDNTMGIIVDRWEHCGALSMRTRWGALSPASPTTRLSSAGTGHRAQHRPGLLHRPGDFSLVPAWATSNHCRVYIVRTASSKKAHDSTLHWVDIAVNGTDPGQR
jgi:hypothetical protein